MKKLGFVIFFLMINAAFVYAGPDSISGSVGVYGKIQNQLQKDMGSQSKKFDTPQMTTQTDKVSGKGSTQNKKKLQGIDDETPNPMDPAGKTTSVSGFKVGPNGEPIDPLSGESVSMVLGPDGKPINPISTQGTTAAGMVLGPDGKPINPAGWDPTDMPIDPYNSAEMPPDPLGKQ
ncbi:MAG: hypothetical protein GY858_10035 [Candidatus Omnitrophica bacterium]|nr:hypothetical protein [Candidatus Omnitrophota bacterium]